MSRCIDADEFMICLRNYRPFVESGLFNAIQTEVNQVLDCIEYEIEDAPSIDIVRCKECKRWLGEPEMYENREYKKCYSFGGFYTAPNDFCSHGEQTEPKCETCKHDDDSWDSEVCDGCIAGKDKPSRYEPKGEE